ncbi:ATP synthase subunit I [Cupriavidus numazuensis]|uniref:ATP synthase subunit I n=1 Tax=Cupriavidus numazuensis TaxID=221992 RepID=UPI001BACA755|nr:ATP synthase subunit I [Cupriavidus numazuensis]
MRQAVVVRDRQQQSDSRRVDAGHDDWDFDAEREEEAVDPLSRAEAVTLFGERALRPSRMTPGKVVLAQVVVTLLSALCWALFAKQAGPYGWSALLGGAVCFVPSGFFAFRLWTARDRASVGGLVMGEAIKVFATVALMVLVVVLYRDLRWVPMLVTFLLALKTYWVVALAMR